MNGNDPSNFRSNLPPIILVLLLASGAFLVQSPIEPDRPPPSGKGLRTEGVQNLEARLWQDPFAVMPEQATQSIWGGRDPESGNTIVELLPIHQKLGPKRDLEWLCKLIQRRDGEVKVMLALVPGGTWVGADEIRRRARYAALAGLDVQGYVPGDPEHVGYVEEVGCEGWLMRLPFEWLSSEGGKDYVLLLWVDEEALGQTIVRPDGKIEVRPLARLARLIERIAGYSGRDKCKYSILGPSSSTFLEAVTQESCLGHQLGTLRFLKVQWYSPYATMPDERIEVQTNTNGESRSLTEELPNFHRLIVSDDQLANALAEELERRRFGGGEVVALVGQWDTAYSRELRRQLEDKIGLLPSFKKESMEIIRVSYLRGVDGRIPGESGKNKENDRQNEKEADKIERPEGEHQVDYLRRLAQELKARESQLSQRIGAIGILGDDYYDKLMTLKALRPAFPDAVFFTTDLDAAMLLPADNKFTRNLVVASGYDLSLVPCLQKDIPPFRTVYQTSTFLAVQVAIHNTKYSNGRVVTPHQIKDWLKPQLFEIGRTVAAPLTQAPEDFRCRKLADCEYPHNSAPKPPGWHYALMMPFAVFVAWFFSWICGFTGRSQNLIWWLSVFGSATLSWLLIYFYNIYPTGQEPLDFVQGVSIWPSELIRLVALILVWALYSRGKSYLERTRTGVGVGFFTQRSDQQTARAGIIQEPKPPAPHKPGKGRIISFFEDFLNRLRNGRRAILERWLGKQKVHPRRSCEDLWRIYTREAEEHEAVPLLVRLPPSILIVLYLSTIACVGLFLKALGMDLPQTPARGSVALWTDKVLILFVVLATQSLLFFAIYHGYRAAWLALELTKGEECEGWQADTFKTLQFHPRTESAGSNNNQDRKRAFSCFGHWLNVSFIATVTEPVQSVIFYPFPVLALLILARSSIFDRWGIPTFLLALFLIFILIVVLEALRLRTACEKVRRQTVKFLTTSMMEAHAKGEKEFGDYIEMLLSQVRDLKIGAFAPFNQQPLVKAVLTLVGSYSGLRLLEYASMANF
jgi:hypothetical protein